MSKVKTKKVAARKPTKKVPKKVAKANAVAAMKPEEPKRHHGTMTVVDEVQGAWVVFDAQTRLFTATPKGTWPSGDSTRIYGRRHGRREGWTASVKEAYSQAKKVFDSLTTAKAVVGVVESRESQFGMAKAYEVVKVRAIEGKVAVQMESSDGSGFEAPRNGWRNPRLTTDPKGVAKLVARVNKASAAYREAYEALTSTLGRHVYYARDLVDPTSTRVEN